MPSPLSRTVTWPSWLMISTFVAPARRAFCRISIILPSSVPVNNRFALDSNLGFTIACMVCIVHSSTWLCL